METECFPSYCLACDRQTGGDPYCSQICRLADLETSSCGSEPTSPTDITLSISSASLSRASGTPFVLPPRFDFSAYRSNTLPSPTAPRPSSNIFFSTPPQKRTASLNQTVSSPRVLTPSSSRSSLTSMQSTSAQEGCMSDQARSELRQYTNSFDQTRDNKRRMTAL
ncbi:hypothetical protein MMC24_003556 [Lignoscripta atroalba]|nr:hypothetical protein [Lignoscripta atroalba]